MAATGISVGTPTLLVQNQVYALPVRRGFLFTSAAVEVSLDGTTFAALTGANTTGIETAAPFIRCTTAGCIVDYKV